MKVNGCQSKWQTPKSGIPQGTVLGPVLFLVFINDLPLSLQNGCSIFADDTTAYTIGDTVTSTCSALSLDLPAASSWAKTWGMLYNAEKSEHLPINTNGRGNVDMDGTIIPQVTAHRHLCVMLNQKLTWNNHIDNLYTSCDRRVGILCRLRNKLQSQVFKKNFHWFHPPEAGVRMCRAGVADPSPSSSDFKKPSVTGTRYTFHLCRRGSNFTRLSCCSRCVRSFHRGTCHPSCRRQCLHPGCTT